MRKSTYLMAGTLLFLSIHPAPFSPLTPDQNALHAQLAPEVV